MQKKKWMPAARRQVLKQLTHYLEIPMALLSLGFFFLVIADFALPENHLYRGWLEASLLLIWGLFIAEFLLRLAIAPHPLRYLKTHWLDLIVLVIPALRMFRLFLIFKGLSLFRLAIGVRRGAAGLGRFLRVSRFLYIMGFTLIVDLAAAAGIYFIERDAAFTQIKSFGDALWWSSGLVTTVSTDLFPVTPGGRVLALVMMVYGMAIFGYFVSQAITYLQSGK